MFINYEYSNIANIIRINDNHLGLLFDLLVFIKQCDNVIQEKNKVMSVIIWFRSPDLHFLMSCPCNCACVWKSYVCECMSCRRRTLDTTHLVCQ